MPVQVASNLHREQQGTASICSTFCMVHDVKWERTEGGQMMPVQGVSIGLSSCALSCSSEGFDVGCRLDSAMGFVILHDLDS